MEKKENKKKRKKTAMLLEEITGAKMGGKVVWAGHCTHAGQSEARNREGRGHSNLAVSRRIFHITTSYSIIGRVVPSTHSTMVNDGRGGMILNNNCRHHTVPQSDI